MSFYAWTHRHVRSILFLMAVLSIGGLASGWGLPVALFPEVSFPRLRVDVEAGDRPAERMALEVTYPIEQALRAIPGVRSVRSTSSRGSADISVNFDWGQDMVAAMLQAESEIARLIPYAAGRHRLRREADGPDGFSRHRLQPHVHDAFAGGTARPGDL